MIVRTTRAAVARFASLVCLLGVLTTTGLVHADTSRLKAVVVLDASFPEAESVFSVLQSHAADLAVDLSAERTVELTSDLRALNRYFRTAAATYQADIVFFSDFGDSDQVVLYVSMPKLGTTLIRNIDAQNETVESRIEITAVVIRGILAAMMSGAEIGVHVTAVPPTGTEETVDTSANGKSNESEVQQRPAVENTENGKTDEIEWGNARVALQAAYGIEFVSGETPPVQHFQPMVRWSIGSMGIFFAYRGTMPFGKEDDALFLSLTPHPLELGFWTAFRKKNVFFRLGAALLMDPLSVKATPKTENAEGEADFVKLRFAASPRIAVDWYLSPTTYVTLAVCADFFIYQNAFYVEKAGAVDGQENDTIVFLRLWPVSPMVQVGFGFGVAK